MVDISDLPVADVQHWNNISVKVRCPFCQKSHLHDFRGYGNEIFQSSCFTDVHCINRYTGYRICFPFKDHTTSSPRTAYEIDKDKRSFVNIGLQTNEEDEENDDESEDEVNGKLARKFEQKIQLQESPNPTRPQFKDATETRIPKLMEDNFYEKDIEYVLSKCAQGDIEVVKNYIETSQERHIFLNGEDKLGNTALILASIKDCPPMLNILVDYGSDINAANHIGRSALMEASLWGRADNVRILLNRGAKKSLRDANWRCARDLALPKSGNAVERYRRAGDNHQYCKTNSNFADTRRKQILCMLDDQPQQSMTDLRDDKNADTVFKYHSFHRLRETNTIKLVAQVANFLVPYPEKTIGLLVRGSPFPNVAAMSGWTYSERHPFSRVWGQRKKLPFAISGQQWTPKALQIADALGYKLPNTNSDHGNPGYYYACHAEMQLIAYFVNKHVLLPVEKEGRLSDLSKINPPVTLTSPTILVSSEICDSCKAFRDLVNSKLGLSIQLLAKFEN